MDISGGFDAGFSPSKGFDEEARINSINFNRAVEAAELSESLFTSSFKIWGD
jgi:hypothetical protein